MYYVEFKTSRRQVSYDQFNLRDFQKDDEYIDFKKGDQFANIALEFQIMKEEDENKRGAHVQALKFYNNE